MSGGAGISPQRQQYHSKDVDGKRISHQTHDTVSQIFKLISDKDTKQQGLQKLFDFKVRSDMDLARIHANFTFEHCSSKILTLI